MRFRVKKDAVYSNSSAVPSGTVDKKELQTLVLGLTVILPSQLDLLISLRLASLYFQQTWTQGEY